MFDKLSDRLGGVFDRLRGRGALNEADVREAMREVRVALLEADVALPVVRDFIDKVTEQAVGAQVLKSVTPGQMVIKIVNDALVEALGGAEQGPRGVDLNAPAPVAILMVGLQGSGKTTTSGKIALRLRGRDKKKVLLASLDVHRPAAQLQLQQLAERAEVTSLPIIAGQAPLEIAARAMDVARRELYDVVVLDTAGRLAIDEALMAEVAEVKAATKPHETLLVVDAMTGQDAVNLARAFDENLRVLGSKSMVAVDQDLWVDRVVFEHSGDKGRDGGLEVDGVDFFDGNSARGGGEACGIIAVAATYGLVADRVDALAAQLFEHQAGRVGFACVGVGTRDEVVHAREVRVGGLRVKSRERRFLFGCLAGRVHGGGDECGFHGHRRRDCRPFLCIEGGASRVGGGGGQGRCFRIQHRVGAGWDCLGFVGRSAGCGRFGRNACQ